MITQYDIHTYPASWQLGKDPGRASPETKFYLIPLPCVAMKNQTFYLTYQTKRDKIIIRLIV